MNKYYYLHFTHEVRRLLKAWGWMTYQSLNMEYTDPELELWSLSLCLQQYDYNVSWCESLYFISFVPKILGIIGSYILSNFGHFWILFLQIMFVSFSFCFINSHSMYIVLLKCVLQVLQTLTTFIRSFSFMLLTLDRSNCPVLLFAYSFLCLVKIFIEPP